MPGIAELGAAGADRPHRRRDQDHPRRLRRRDAAQPRVAGGRRAVRHAGGAPPRPDRPRHRPRARHRPGHRGALRRSPEALSRGRLPRAARATCSASSPAAGRTTTRSRRSPRCPAAATARPSGCSAPAATAPRWPACSGCRSPSPTTSARTTRCPRWPCTAQHFRPSETLDQPYAMIAAAVVCAETDERARFLAGPSALSFLRLRTGRPGPLPSPEEAAAYPYTELERAFIERRLATPDRRRPETVRRGSPSCSSHRRRRADDHHQVYDPADRSARSSWSPTWPARSSEAPAAR